MAKTLTLISQTTSLVRSVSDVWWLIKDFPFTNSLQQAIKGISLSVLRKKSHKIRRDSKFSFGFTILMVHFLQAHTGYEMIDSQQGMCHQVGYDNLNRQEFIIEMVHGKRISVTLDLMLNSPHFYKETQRDLDAESSSLSEVT